MYSAAPMPWMQRLTRSGTALHGGVVPGYPASHSCIRLPFSFAPKLFAITTGGENVVVAYDPTKPRFVEHSVLFEPVSPTSDANLTERTAQTRLQQTMKLTLQIRRTRKREPKRSSEVTIPLSVSSTPDHLHHYVFW